MCARACLRVLLLLRDGRGQGQTGVRATLLALLEICSPSHWYGSKIKSSGTALTCLPPLVSPLPSLSLLARFSLRSPPLHSSERRPLHSSMPEFVLLVLNAAASLTQRSSSVDLIRCAVPQSASARMPSSSEETSDAEPAPCRPSAAAAQPLCFERSCPHFCTAATAHASLAPQPAA